MLRLSDKHSTFNLMILRMMIPNSKFILFSEGCILRKECKPLNFFLRTNSPTVLRFPEKQIMLIRN